MHARCRAVLQQPGPLPLGARRAAAGGAGPHRLVAQAEGADAVVGVAEGGDAEAAAGAAAAREGVEETRRRVPPAVRDGAARHAEIREEGPPAAAGRDACAEPQPARWGGLAPLLITSRGHDGSCGKTLSACLCGYDNIEHGLGNAGIAYLVRCAF